MRAYDYYDYRVVMFVTLVIAGVCSALAALSVRALMREVYRSR